MRLVNCYVENFGKLSNYSYDFTEGLNVVRADNGSGKSTLMGFIKAMFYGLANDSKRDYTNERKKYSPWQGGIFGGRLTFIIDGKTLEISRTFGKKASEDTFTIIDKATNLPTNYYTTNIGREIFGIDEDSFSRSAFIAQGGVPASVSSDINAKIGNLADNTNDMGNFELAITAITNKLNKLSENRATGEICNYKSEAMKLKGEISLEESYEDAMEALREKISNSQRGIQELGKENEQLATKMDALSIKKDNEVKASKFEILNKQYCEAQEAMEVAEAEARKAREATINGPRRSGLGIVGIVLMVLGVVAVVATYLADFDYEHYVLILGIAFFGFGLVLGIISLIINSNAKKEQENLSIEYSKAQARYEALLSTFESAKKALEDFTNEHGTSFGEEVKVDTDLSTVELNDKIKANCNEIERLKNFIRGYNEQLEEKEEKLAEIANKKDRLLVLTTLIDEGRKKVRNLELTKELLTKAKLSVTSKYIDPISGRFNHYFEVITSGSADSFRIDADSNVTKDELGSYRDTITLSTGLQDAVGFSLRMALVDAMYQGEKPFVILDDAFSNMDDKNYSGAMKVLNEVADTYQVIYFTCHSK